MSILNINFKTDSEKNILLSNNLYSNNNHETNRERVCDTPKNNNIDVKFLEEIVSEKEIISFKNKEENNRHNLPRKNNLYGTNDIIQKKNSNPSNPAKGLWNKARKMIRGVIYFNKINKNLQLYGTGNEDFDEKNPNEFLQKLKQFQISQIFKLTDSQNTSLKKKCIKKFTIPVFHPDSFIINIWNMIIGLLMIYTAIVMPFRVSFIFNEDQNWSFIDTLIDFFFITDIVITLNMGYFDSDNKLINSRKEIFLTYLKSWLITDIISSFPQNLIINSLQSNQILRNSDILRLIRIAKLYKLLRVIRVLKIAKIFKRIAYIQKILEFFNINYGISRLISFLFTTLLISHLMACLWYILPKIYDENSCWVAKLDLQDEDPFRLYLFSLYWTLTTIFTVGFGDMHAFNSLEYVISIFWMLFGVGFYSFTIGTLSSIIINMETRENILKSKLNILNEYCKETKISSEIREKIIKILIYNSRRNALSWVDKQELFAELPANIKFEIAKSMRCGFLKEILFFSNKDDSFIAMIVPFLIPYNFQEKESIYKKMDHPSAIYFLKYGRVHFVNKNGVPFRTMVKGSYFGEIEIIMKQKRSHSVISVTLSDTLTLSKQIYEDIVIKEYPEIHEEIRLIAKCRKEKNSKSKYHICGSDSSNNSDISKFSDSLNISYCSKINRMDLISQYRKKKDLSLNSCNISEFDVNKSKILKNNCKFNDSYVNSNNSEKNYLDIFKHETSHRKILNGENQNSMLNEIKNQLTNYSYHQKQILNYVETIQEKNKLV